jgi:hypothetical protein
MKRIILITITLLMCPKIFTQCQLYTVDTPPLLKNVLLNTKIHFDSSSNHLLYNYSLKNGDSSTGCISMFEIDLTKSANSCSLSNQNLVDYPKHVSRDSSIFARAPQMVPVGIPNLPSYKGFTSAWITDFTIEGKISWGSGLINFLLEPGDSLIGMVLTSYGLPGIRSFSVIPWYNPEVPDDSLSDDPMGIENVIDSTSILGSTVGPSAPPKDSITYIDSIKSYTMRSRTLGWITEQSTAEKYTTYFDSAKVQLQRNVIRATRATLDTVLANANLDSSSTLTSEAYALIYFNTEYLLNQLPIPPPQYKLNLNTIGNGTVTPSPEYTLYDSATIVTLTAGASTGYKFSGWSGDVSDTINPLSLVMNSEKTITATFTQNVFVITASAGANGTISPVGTTTVNCGGSQTYTLTPAAHYHVDSIIVDGSYAGNGASYTFTNVTANHTIRGVFAIDTYTLTIQITGNGTVTKTPDLTVYPYGTSVSLRARPSVGTLQGNVTPKTPEPTSWKFDHWEVDLTGTQNPKSITMNGNKTVRAVFLPVY